MKKDSEFYLRLLGRLLLEIRNLDNAQLSHARSLAYIFHNVPSLLRSNFKETTPEEAYEVIRSRAEHFGLLEWIDEWERSILQQIGDN